MLCNFQTDGSICMTQRQPISVPDLKLYSTPTTLALLARGRGPWHPVDWMRRCVTGCLEWQTY